ncbi:hypothetical protein [Sphingopyxis sp. PET50]|uniref:hypothetical protein n=1 Tax=Sphingopyxis sp. PET50 TaxID=2976533 RepID=UPI0021AFB202|nr:hypothetical protein [Sphingopyxis sp. PET50]
MSGPFERRAAAAANPMPALFERGGVLRIDKLCPDVRNAANPPPGARFAVGATGTGNGPVSARFGGIGISGFGRDGGLEGKREFTGTITVPMG